MSRYGKEQLTDAEFNTEGSSVGKLLKQYGIVTDSKKNHGRSF